MKRFKLAVAGVVLAVLGFAAGGVAHAAFQFFVIAPGDSGYLVCSAPGNQALGVQIAAYENGEPVAFYFECKNQQ